MPQKGVANVQITICSKWTLVAYELNIYIIIDTLIHTL